MNPLVMANKFGRKGLISAFLAGSLLFGGMSGAEAWSGKTHEAIAKAAGSKIPRLATIADIPVLNPDGTKKRTFEHWVNKPEIEKDLQAGVDRVFDVGKKNSYDASHLIGDFSQPMHAGPYNDFNKKFHKINDEVLNKINLDYLKDVPAAKGDLATNIKNLILDSNKKYQELERENRAMTPKEAMGRVRKSVAIQKQMYPHQTAPTLANILAERPVAKKSWGLTKETQSLLERMTVESEKQGLYFRVTEGIRTQARQNALYKEGRHRTSRRVSEHQFGRAFDIIALESKGGKGSYNIDYNKLGAVGKKVGLEWSGDWKSGTRERVHFQIPNKKAKKIFANKTGLVNKVLHNKKIGHDAGTASTKAANIVKQTLKRVITKR